MNERIQRFSVLLYICVPIRRLICPQEPCKPRITIVDCWATPCRGLKGQFFNCFSPIQLQRNIAQLLYDLHVRWPGQNLPRLANACSERSNVVAPQCDQWYGIEAFENQSKCHGLQHAQDLWQEGIELSQQRCAHR